MISISHPLEAVGVVLRQKKLGESKSAQNGELLCAGGKQKQVCWVPHDCYVVKTTRDDACVVSNVLEDIRKQVLVGEFNKIDHAKITLQKTRCHLRNQTPKGKKAMQKQTKLF